jgi:hypothetical protein
MKVVVESSQLSKPYSTRIPTKLWLLHHPGLVDRFRSLSFSESRRRGRSRDAFASRQSVSRSNRV